MEVGILLSDRLRTHDFIFILGIQEWYLNPPVVRVQEHGSHPCYFPFLIPTNQSLPTLIHSLSKIHLKTFCLSPSPSPSHHHLSLLHLLFSKPPINSLHNSQRDLCKFKLGHITLLVIPLMSSCYT